MSESEATVTRVATAAASSSPAHRQPWWRNAVIYEIYVRSFADGNGDGVGDLIGIRSRLDHLAELGVDAVWLSPFFASPMADGGYDVRDYRAVAPEFGTLDDFDALVADAHRLGIRVVIDVVPNHTSHEHPWFTEALAAGPGSPARDRYLFRPGRGSDGAEPPNNWESVFGGSAWTRVTEPDGRPGEWYLHLFAPEQPDLNWRNPEVQSEFRDVLRFWLDRGVDGIRIDVAHGLFKAEGLPDDTADREGILDTTPRPYWDQEEVHDVYRDWRALLDSYPGDRMAVAEAWLPTLERMSRYVRPDELHQAFNFAFLSTDFDPGAFREVIDATVRTLAEVNALPTWVLSNHDVVRHTTRYGGGEQGLRRARTAVLVMLALPGATYLYQGEELGLEQVTDLPDEVLQDPVWRRSGYTDRGRDGCRVPIPWDGDQPPFGFGERSWLPVPEAWRTRTVAAQTTDPDSTLRMYQQALGVRRVLGGSARLDWLDTPDTVLGFRTDSGLVCTANMGTDPVEINVPGELLVSTQQVHVSGVTTVLPPESAAWWRA
ncbi:alpha-amylase family glycosyl hydrolase [Lipingzhangella sp. LS1_29]|uniref:Alpha-amylase family glycosyl hydrolase n=1 Tax=Lipingzhangella rawalii TaxID=2055835 RepID=A0ABU2H365_9ACTN|nr:alpha-amylase family glycosyl hydrolase [Lipingzhangella rawalii]MDS1269289.1 alpha-amylase family glycosyl hydrolase [Lipingzhangella rawalii]